MSAKLYVGRKIVYPSLGPCLIGSIVKRIIDGKPHTFYQLNILDEQGGDLFIPVDKVDSIGIRLLIDKIEIPLLLDQLRKPADPDIDWKQRSSNNIKRFASGSAFDLAEVVESLTEQRKTKPLSFGESKRLERAKSLLVCEISEAMGVTKQEAERQIDNALKARDIEEKLATKAKRDGVNRRIERSH